MTTDLFFKNKLQAFKWLQQQRAPVGKSAFYNACAAGELRVEADNSISKVEVSEYLRKLEGSRRNVAGGSSLREEADTRKALADATKAELQVEEMQRQLDRKWIERDKAEAATGALLIMLFNNIAYQTQKAAPEVAVRLGLDVARREEIEIYIDEVVSRAFNEISASKLVNMNFDEDDTLDDIDQEES